MAGAARSTVTNRTTLQPPTDRTIRRLLLSDAAAAAHAQARCVHRHRRVQPALGIESDVVVHHKLVASIMDDGGLCGPSRLRSHRGNMATIATASDLVNQHFADAAKNQMERPISRNIPPPKVTSLHVLSWTSTHAKLWAG